MTQSRDQRAVGHDESSQGTFVEEDVVRLRMSMARITRFVERQVSRGDMTRSQLSVLAAIARLGPVGASELAEFEGLNPTMLSRIIGKLEVLGLVTRSTHPDDGRAVLVEATAAGMNLQLRLRAERTTLFAERLSMLSDERAAQLLAAIPAIEALAEQMHRPDPISTDANALSRAHKSSNT
ncbi:MarR family winged helix-turn-helix transcriptional regulator [Jatrophihabitans sp. DSM 45814]